MGRVLGKGVSPSPADYGVCGERRELLQRGPGETPAAYAFISFLFSLL